MPYTHRDNFDPYDNIKNAVKKKYKHIWQLEDFWMNVQDDFEVKKKMHSKLPLDFIRKCKAFSVVDQAQDSGKYLQPAYEKEEKSIKINWSEAEDTYLKDLMKQVLAYTCKWIEVQHNKLKEQNVQLTFELEKEDDENDASTSGSTTQSTHSKGSKRKENQKEKGNKILDDSLL